MPAQPCSCSPLDSRAHRAFGRVQEAEYKALVKAQEAAIAVLTDGAPMGGAQTAAIEALKVRFMLHADIRALPFNSVLNIVKNDVSSAALAAHTPDLGKSMPSCMAEGDIMKQPEQNKSESLSACNELTSMPGSGGRAAGDGGKTVRQCGLGA